MGASHSSAGLHIGVRLGNVFERKRANDPHPIVNIERFAQASLPRAAKLAPRFQRTRPT